jgi:cobalt-zinc-cadmium efflux system outer membrane protein
MKTRLQFKSLCVCVLAGALCAAGIAHAQAPAELGALTLPSAEALLGAKNRDIALARRALEQAQADVQVAGQPPNPQLSWTTQNINPKMGIGAGPLRGKTVDSIARVDQLIERGNKLGLRVDTARRLETAAGEDLNDIGRQQLLALRSAYYDLIAAQDKVLTARDTAQLFDKTVDAAQQRQRAGDLAASDVARIRVDALRAQNDARAAEADVARARLALAYLIGADREAAALRAVTPWPARDAQGAASVEELVNRRADVRAAQARVEAADKARDLAQAQRTRDVSVGVQFEHFPSSDSNPQGSGNSFGVAVSVPLFLRHNYEGTVARAQADWYAARDGLERVKALAASEVLRARSDLDSATERLARVEADLLPAAQKSADAAEFAFKNGALGVMDLLDARRTLKAVLIDATNARADHAKALAAWQSNLEATNNNITGLQR